MKYKIKGYDSFYDGYYYLFVRSNSISFVKELDELALISPKVIKEMDSNSFIECHFTLDNMNDFAYVDNLYCYSNVDFSKRSKEFLEQYEKGFQRLIQYKRVLSVYGNEDEFNRNYQQFLSIRNIPKQFIPLGDDPCQKDLWIEINGRNQNEK